MCSNIIIDVNRAHRFTKQRKNPLYADKKLNESINDRHFKVVYSKDLSFEQDRRDNNWNNKLEEWKKYGQAILNRTDLSQSIENLKKLKKELEKKVGRKMSDDFHILALAQITNTRILYTGDKRLKKDFTNKEIIKINDTKIYTEEASSEKIESFLNEHKCADKN